MLLSSILLIMSQIEVQKPDSNKAVFKALPRYVVDPGLTTPKALNPEERMEVGTHHMLETTEYLLLFCPI